MYEYLSYPSMCMYLSLEAEQAVEVYKITPHSPDNPKARHI